MCLSMFSGVKKKKNDYNQISITRLQMNHIMNNDRDEGGLLLDRFVVHFLMDSMNCQNKIGKC